jgi:GT2 family glycosyltransferase
LDSVGLLDEETFFMYWEDVDLSFRLRNSGWKLAVAPASHLQHKENASLGLTNPKLITYLTKSSIRFFLKHSRFPVLPISIAIGGRVIMRVVCGKFNESLTVIRAGLSLTPDFFR